MTLIEELLRHGTGDWINPGWVESAARRRGIQEIAHARIAAVGAVCVLVLRGDLMIGDVNDSFTERNGDTTELLSDVVDEWLSWPTSTSPTPGAICWFALTPKS